MIRMRVGIIDEKMFLNKQEIRCTCEKVGSLEKRKITHSMGPAGKMKVLALRKETGRCGSENTKDFSSVLCFQ